MTTTELTPQSLKDLLGFPFRGKEWQTRFLIGVGLFLLGFIPILPAVFLLGYFARLVRLAKDGQVLELPEWKDWGGLARDGFRLFGVNLIYMLPGMLVLLGSMIAYFTGFFLMIPVTALAEQNSDAAVAIPLLMFGLWGIMMLGMFLGNLLLFLGAVPLPMAMARAADQQRFGAAFQLRQITLLIWRNKAGYFVAWVVLAGLAAIAYLFLMMVNLTLIFMWVGMLLWIPFSFYLLVVMAALFGQTYAESMQIVDKERS